MLNIPLALSLMAGTLFMGCATTTMASSEKLSLMAQNSSCSAPLIIQHNLKGDNKDAISSRLIPETERLARIIAMGYDIAPNKVPSDQSVSRIQNCSQSDTYTYRVTPKSKQSAEAPYETLYVRHLTRAAIKADPNVICKPSYTQVYQPPLKLGGAGRVIQVPSSQKCKIDFTKQALNSKKSKNASPLMREVKFTSLPSGAIVTVHRTGDFADTPGGCTTPCSMQLDARQPWTGIVQMAGERSNKGEFIPIAFPPKDSKGVNVHFTRTAPMNISLNALSAEVYDRGEAVLDKKAKPLVTGIAIMPPEATKSGRCNMVFDVTPTGIPTNIQAESCTDKVFRAASFVSIAKWYFNPRLKSGKAVGIAGVEKKVSFRLVGSDGKVLAE